MKKLNLENLKLEANDMLQRNELKSVFGGGGYGINPYCCFDYADYILSGIPNYADPTAEGYLTPTERNDVWSYYYDGCMNEGVAQCMPAV